MSWSIQSNGEERCVADLPKLLIMVVMGIIKEKYEIPRPHLTGT